ncbi:hypothetical protein X758_02140 [Mesorhizobium sp. LSHC416B00]|nr:hypothetical protein X761_01645 [Mesorhizobium sp. LSHC424B00]ESX76516.1 hypothetical protein X758_02140 [Mesorhizobium sp. LSHC416B00]
MTLRQRRVFLNMISIFAATAEVIHAAPPGQPEAGWALVSISMSDSVGPTTIF